MMRINLLIITCFVFTTLVLGQGNDLSVENKIDKASVTIGDLITYTLTVTHDESIEVQLPGRAFVVVDSAMQFLPDDALNISDYKINEPAKIDGKITEGVEYVFSPFIVGKFIIASLTIQFKVPGDTTAYKINAEPIPFVVQSIVPSEAGDIRDIKPQWEIERDLWLLLKPVLMAFIVVVIIVLLIIMYKRWKAGKALLPVLEKPKRPAHEIALERLDNLVKSGLLADGKVKEFYIRFSDTIRHYIEDRFHVEALEMTTMQLISNMKNIRIDEEIMNLVRDFLNLSDMVKFAKYFPEEDETRQAIQQAYEIVNITKIVNKPEVETNEPEAVVEPEEKSQEAPVVEDEVKTSEESNEREPQ